MENGNLTSQPERLWRRTALACAAAIALSVGLSACVPGANAVNERKAEQMNLANQRDTAIKFLGMQGGVEKIMFTQEGTYSGAGTWATNAIITIEGRDYNEILGIWILGGDQLPDIPVSSSPTPSTVIYSDGSSEVIG